MHPRSPRHSSRPLNSKFLPPNAFSVTNDDGEKHTVQQNCRKDGFVGIFTESEFNRTCPQIFVFDCIWLYLFHVAVVLLSYTFQTFNVLYLHRCFTTFQDNWLGLPEFPPLSSHPRGFTGVCTTELSITIEGSAQAAYPTWLYGSTNNEFAQMPSRIGVDSVKWCWIWRGELGYHSNA